MFYSDPLHIVACSLVDEIDDIISSESNPIQKPEYQITVEGVPLATSYESYSDFIAFYSNLLKESREISQSKPEATSIIKLYSFNLESMLNKFNKNSWRLYEASKILNNLETAIRLNSFKDFNETKIATIRKDMRNNLDEIVALRNKAFESGVDKEIAINFVHLIDQTLTTIHRMDKFVVSYLDFQNFIEKHRASLKRLQGEIEVELILNKDF